ncbi:MAG: TPM domain-containing protein [Burkholderiales bacterium]
MTVRRALSHMLAPPWLVRRAFPKAALDRIEAAVTASEQKHRGEIRFAVEGALEFLPVLRGLTAHQRALDVFSLLRVWDTDENTGVLIYLQIVDREIEIVADRGIAHRIEQHEWDAICRRMEKAFTEARYDDGVIAGIAEVSELLARHFPGGTINPDELPDKPVTL